MKFFIKGLWFVVCFFLVPLNAHSKVVEGIGLPDTKVFATDEVRHKLPQHEVGDPEFSFLFNAKSSRRAPRKTSCVLFCPDKGMVLELAKLIVYDLEFSDQFSVAIRHPQYFKNQDPGKKELKKLFEEKHDLCFYLFPTEDESKDGTQKIYFNVYQTGTKGTKVFEKIAVCKKDAVVTHGHTLASMLLQQLTGSPGLCMHTIAYCVAKGPLRKDIYIADYAGFKSIPVITGPGIKLAPSFHNKAPYVFFTQLTRRNARLQMRDLRSKYETNCFSFPGLNMQLTLAPDGIRALVCFSSGKGNAELFHYDQRISNKVGKQVFQQITNNGGNNVSPCYLPNDDIVFCSDFETGLGRPQLYYFDRKKNKTTRLTSGKGYCAAPSYCAATHSLIYTRLINRVFQLFSINLHQLHKVKELDERQLTFCAGDKTEPSWDATGRYAVFLYEFKDTKNHRKSQIAVLNLNSDSIRIITKGPEAKSFPTITSRILYQG